jgi:signal transduction histidine kinase
VKYTPEGGRIDLRLTETESAVIVEIADNGPGIPPALRAEVFRRFFRADDSRSTPGSGLGLSLVQAVIQIHNATIELQDNAPGLRVRVQLERIAPPHAEPEPAPT